MNRKTLPILLLAFVVASLCSLFVWHIVADNSAAAQRAKAKHVVAASGNIKLGTVLTPSNLTTIDIAGTLPQGAILDSDKSRVIGRGVTSDLYQGEAILESRLAPVGSGGGLAATIPNGMRVCAVKVDEVVGVSGFVTPGMRVDILASGTPPGVQNQNEGPQVTTLLQNIEVKSAGTDIQKDAEGKPHPVQVVNLLVAPDQAETLSLASSQMHIQLVLRNPLDTQTAKLPGNAMVNLFAGSVKAPVKPPVTSGVKHVKKAVSEDYSVEVFNGSKHSAEKFAAPEVKQ
jgi:pilus assembly protein CpaB